jgi:hypothetical protein
MKVGDNLLNRQLLVLNEGLCDLALVVIERWRAPAPAP